MNAVPARIVLVEDDVDMADVIRDNLLAEGHSVDVARDGEQALEVARGRPYDLMILDIMLPRLDGLSVCETLRREGIGMPVLFLTAKGDPDDRIRGLEAGGDDYLPKPFHLREFLLRVERLLRRQHAMPPTMRIRFGGNVADPTTRRATAWDGSKHELSGEEVRVLECLAQHEGEVVSRQQILEEAWRSGVCPSSRTVNATIARLRRRFEPEPDRFVHFHDAPAGCYRFTREPTHSAAEVA